MTDEDRESPIIHCSDGPRLILANGQVVRLIVTDRHTGNEMAFVKNDQGASVYGLESKSRVDIAVVDDREVVEAEEGTN